jgi:hypothetical protein
MNGAPDADATRESDGPFAHQLERFAAFDERIDAALDAIRMPALDNA